MAPHGSLPLPVHGIHSIIHTAVYWVLNLMKHLLPHGVLLQISVLNALFIKNAMQRSHLSFGHPFPIELSGQRRTLHPEGSEPAWEVEMSDDLELKF